MFAAIKSSRAYPAGLMAGLMGVMVLASAQAPAATPAGDIAVRYTDLDIHTTAGAEKLYQRIRLAAVQVCPQVNQVEIQRHMAAMRCVNAAVAQAVNSIASPQLAAVYAAHRVHAPV